MPESRTTVFRYDLPNGWQLMKVDGSYSLVAPHLSGEDAIVGKVTAEVERFVADMTGH